MLSLLLSMARAETIRFSDPWADPGFNLHATDAAGVTLVYSIGQLRIENYAENGYEGHLLSIPGHLFFQPEGAPNLPGANRFIALPEGAEAELHITASRVETYRDIRLVPAPPIRIDNDDRPIDLHADPDIYSRDAYFPDSPVTLTERKQMRGVDVVQLSICPFQYNPVTRELLVYRDLRIQVEFLGGSGAFGEDRLRSIYWEPILKNHLLNYNQLPKFELTKCENRDEEGYEYLIIVPDDPAFIAWGDSLKCWRTLQGINTGVVTVAEIGGYDPAVIEEYIDYAYRNWSAPPVGVLLLGDQTLPGNTPGVPVPIIDYIPPNFYEPYGSDNKYADFDDDYLPDMAFSRITAQNEEQLATMIGRQLDYERNPVTNPDFYDHPILTGGWQLDRWFILTLEILHGYFTNVQQKMPTREYAIWMGVPGSIWSSYENTQLVVDYFGPAGLGYITYSPAYLTDWGATAARVNASVNSGAFLVQHRDHAMYHGWWTPEYSHLDIQGITTDMPSFLISVNCNSGKFEEDVECFGEDWHQHEHGAIGFIASTTWSYSYTGDAYVWGLYDSMWPDFDPNYGSDEPGVNNLRPCFANVSGKFYCEASVLPPASVEKRNIYNSYHHHGDVFLTLNDKVPEPLPITHDSVIIAEEQELQFNAPENTVVALTKEGEIIGVVLATGAPQMLEFDPQPPGTTLLLTATLYNHLRYTAVIPVVSSGGSYVTLNAITIDDAAGNQDGRLNPGEEAFLEIAMVNVGEQTADDVEVTINCNDLCITMLDSSEFYGSIATGEVVTIPQGFQIQVDPMTPGGYRAEFELSASTSQGDQWISHFSIEIVPNLDLTVTPVNPPIIIPANGGIFEFEIEAENIDLMPLVIDCWSMILTPDSSLIGPLLLASGYDMAGGSLADCIRQQSVPGNAAPGTYQYSVCGGDYPDAVWVQEQFEFVKSSMGDGPFVTGWENTGENLSATQRIPAIPTEVSLSTPYPNPFNPLTTIRYCLPAASHVTMQVFNIRGQVIATLVDGMQDAALHEVHFDASQLASGIYFYRIEAGDFTAVRKMILMK